MKYFMIMFLFITFVACGEQTESNNETTNTPETVSTEQVTSKTAVVSGTIANGRGSLLQLNMVATGPVKTIQTNALGEDGVFSFNIPLEEPGFYSVALSEINSCLLYLEPGSTTALTADASDIFSSYQLEKAGHDSKLIKQYFGEFNRINEDLKAISTEMAALDFNADSERQALIEKSTVLSEEFQKFQQKFLEKNPDSPMLLAIIGHFDPATQMDKVDEIVASVKRNFPNSPYSTMAQRTRDEMHLSYMTQSAGERIQPGKEAPDLVFPNPMGETIKLSDLRGKIVLLDFWASWCKPCRAENPNVVRMYNQYKEKGFEVFSFSLDQDPTRWKNAIQQDGLIWPNHASDLQQWNTAAIPLYGFRGIPYTVLIDKNGKIIETNLRGPALEQKLKALFG